MTRLLFALFLALLASAAIGSNAAAQDAAVGDPNVTTGDVLGIINSNGTFEDGRRITSSTRLSTGTYDIRTNRLITRCACLITHGNPTSFFVATGFTPTCVQRSGSAGRGWFIQLFDTAGNLADREFTVVGACRN